jgi:hypothetical protein
MIIMHYVEGAPAVNDFNLEKMAQQLKDRANDSDSWELWFSTDNIFNKIRVMVVEGEIDYKSVKFIINGEVNTA